MLKKRIHLLALVLFCAAICEAKSKDAWNEHDDPLAKGEKPCVTWAKLNKIDPGLKEIGRLAVRNAKEIKSSKWSVGCETMDRDFSEWDEYKRFLGPLGAKHGRLFSGWAKTEREKGKYDFAWLDKHVREMAAMGVKPWICLSYGNPVWGSDFNLGMKVRQVTDNPEAFEAWLRYVAACVGRYKDVVDEWEIWNEPFHQGPEYAELFYRTAKVVREVQPEAKCMCTAVTFPDDYKCVLDKLKAENAYDLASYFVYHPYVPNPDAAFKKRTKPLLKLVKSYSDKFRILQGEAGCPTQLEWAQAMKQIEWSEYAQAKWNLRRMLDDAARSIPSSVFTIIDLQYWNVLDSFGLIRASSLKKVVYRRPSYYAMQNLFGYIDDDVTPADLNGDIEYELVGKANPLDKERHKLKSVLFKREGLPVRFYWFSDRMPTANLAFDHVTVRGIPGKLKDLAWVEMITGRVFEIPDENVLHDGEKTALVNLPMWDSPILIAERRSIPLRRK